MITVLLHLLGATVLLVLFGKLVMYFLPTLLMIGLLIFGVYRSIYLLRHG